LDFSKAVWLTVPTSCYILSGKPHLPELISSKSCLPEF
jgi:hypothetical protein